MADHIQQPATVGDKGRLTLPDEIRKALGLKPGDVVLIEVTDRGTAEITPAALVPKDQVWFTHPEAQARVREALADIEKGRTTRARTPAQLLAHLDRLKGEGSK